jgi:N-acetylmuramoyl-L-alanine amidase
MMGWPRVFGLLLVAWLGALPVAAGADELTALARLDPAASAIEDLGQGVSIVLAISQPVPYRISFMANPDRLVVDFREVDFGANDPGRLNKSRNISDLRWGAFAPGWSRLVAVLDRPVRLESAEERSGPAGTAKISLRFAPTTAADFTSTALALAASAKAEGWALPLPAKVDAPILRQTGDHPLKVVLDPGHGGIDPGAEAGKTDEAKVILGFAIELAETLRRAGMTVNLTRQTDVFVPLETRISIARAAGADLFLSLHADALAEGEATGATVYKLAPDASDAASAQLAERHDRADLLAGVDLSDSDDEVAKVLMDLARRETQPRADKLAEALVVAIQAKGLKMHRHPIQAAAFSVLKSADIPSLLLEVGFLSSEKDRERLVDPKWRADMQGAILQALEAWAITDAAEARLLRQ